MRKLSNISKRTKKGTALMFHNNFYVNNISIRDIRTIFHTHSAHSYFSRAFYLNIICGILAINIMVQIRMSMREQTIDYIDKLPSYKDYKKKFITGIPGRSIAVASGLVLSYPYILDTLENIPKSDPSQIYDCIFEYANTFLDENIPNTKRLSKPSSSATWPAYAKSEMSAALGLLLSCPGTNIKLLNIDPSKAANATLLDVLNYSGFDQEFFHAQQISIDDIRNVFCTYMLADSGGFPLNKIEYHENPQVISSLEKDLLGDSITRIGTVNTALNKGSEPDSAITRKDILANLLNYELTAYEIAFRSGDPALLRKYTNLVKKRIQDNNTSPNPAPIETSQTILDINDDPIVPKPKSRKASQTS